MTVKPSMVARVIRLGRRLRWLSGTNSAMTTDTIAPAAKDNAKGSSACTCTASRQPIMAEIGSTAPLSCPKKKALLRLMPSRRRGRLTAAPSGKFCRAMPMASIHAAVRAAGV